MVNCINGVAISQLDYTENRGSFALVCNDSTATQVSVNGNDGVHLMCANVQPTNIKLPYSCPSSFTNTVLGVDYIYDVSVDYGVVLCSSCESTNGLLNCLDSDNLVYIEDPKCIVNVDAEPKTYCSVDDTYK